MNKKSQVYIAQKAGITQGYLSKVFQKTVNPTIEVLKRIADTSGIELSLLIEGSPSQIKQAISELKSETKEVA